ncbi:hypothetical protein GALMADRAFT_1247852 [Galerina marginata CBS 339.88]|uniref:Uncharacterized protein n=1 Tax=Galerina marginata (strain CBS 339.88) TaxID=685588 RepID=A0A067T963_GALM3|nr:hypothetical protein GALMADRAFT_1247852 [Galerina marginata CBS 339.88]
MTRAAREPQHLRVLRTHPICLIISRLHSASTFFLAFLAAIYFVTQAHSLRTRRNYTVFTSNRYRFPNHRRNASRSMFRNHPLSL